MKYFSMKKILKRKREMIELYQLNKHKFDSDTQKNLESLFKPWRKGLNIEPMNEAAAKTAPKEESTVGVQDIAEKTKSPVPKTWWKFW